MTLLSRPGRLQLVVFFCTPLNRDISQLRKTLAVDVTYGVVLSSAGALSASKVCEKKQLTSTLQGCCATILFLFCVEKYAKQKMIIYDKPRTSAKLADSMQKSPPNKLN